MAEFTRREAITKLAATAGVGALILAATAEARAVETFHHEGAGSDVHVEWGAVEKAKDGEYTVKFRKGFGELPTVLLTPWWHGDGREVSHVETIVSLSHNEFKATSGNFAENYFVSWLAIGKKKD
jgi:hypothetical protein